MYETQASTSFSSVLLRCFQLRFQLISYLLLFSMSACGGSSGSAAPKNMILLFSVPVIVPIPITPVKNPPTTMLHTAGTQWQSADGKQKLLKGVNLGNWLLQEFWMMGQGSNGIDDQCKLEATLDQRFGYAERQRLYSLFRQNWIGSRDWDMIEKFGFNVVRLPFNWSLIEDEKNPMHLRLRCMGNYG